MQNWIMFFMNPSGERISYTTNELNPEKTSLSYRRFLNFVYENYKVNDRAQFQNKLDSFQTIILYRETGDWEVIKSDHNSKKVSFEELYSLKAKREEDEQKKDKIKNTVQKSKEFVNRLWNKKKEDARILSK